MEVYGTKGDIMITKPMLAGTVKDLSKIQYPVLCTPKLDGIRLLKLNGKALSRNFKPIPNKFIRELVEKHFPDGVDGELILSREDSNPLTGCMIMDTFNKTSSAVMSEDGKPWVVFHIFDYVKDGIDKPYDERMADLKALMIDDKSGIPGTHAAFVLPTEIYHEEQLLKLEERVVADGYEGLMIRSVQGPYKCGRSTEREGYLLKLKRFKDSEAEILGFEEKMTNNNLAKKDELGRTKRSSHKANKVGADTLGKIKVRDIKTGVEFGIGTGFDDDMRRGIWENQKHYTGQIVKYKYQPSGAKDLPRFPVFLGFRHKDDMGE